MITRSQLSPYLMLKLLQALQAQLQTSLGGTEGNPLQNDVIPLQPVAQTLLHHYVTEKS